MANRRRREDWNRRAQQVREICADPALALWQKAYRVGGAYQDVQLDRLQSKHRRRIFDAIANVNAILARYPIETFDDYQAIDTRDLNAIVETFKAFALIKI